jgi:hypothetical protein
MLFLGFPLFLVGWIQRFSDLICVASALRWFSVLGKNDKRVGFAR